MSTSKLGDTVVITQVKPVWTLGKEKLFIAGNTSEIKIIEKQKQDNMITSKNKTPKKERNNVKNEKLANIEIKNPQVQDLCVCLRNGISNTTDLASNPFLSNSSLLQSIFSPGKKRVESTDEIEAKKEITFSFTIIGWKDTTTGIGKKYEKIIDENIDTINVGVGSKGEVEVEVEVNSEKKSARKSFGNNFKTVTKRNSTAKIITRMSITPHKTDLKIKNNEEINISNITTIEIHGVNEDTRMGILLEYKIYSALMPYLISDWLEPGKEIKVCFGLITEIDKNHDMIRILRSEHTIVTVKCSDICHENLNSATEKKNERLSTIKNAVRNDNKNNNNNNKNNNNNNNVNNNDHNKENNDVRKDNFNVNNSDNVNDNKDENDKNNINKKRKNNKNTDKNDDDNNVHNATTILQRTFRNNILENERNRYDALCQNKTEFQNVPNDCLESCFRHRINNAYVRIKATRKFSSQNLTYAGNVDENSSLKIVENSEISGSLGIEFDGKEVSVEDCKEDSVAVMMTCASDEVIHTTEQQQQQQQHVAQSVAQGHSEDRLTDQNILDDQNTSPETTESIRAYRQETVSLTVSKDNRTEIMQIEYSLLPSELQNDFQSSRNLKDIPENVPTTQWNGRTYDIVFTRTWTSNSELKVGTDLPPPHAHLRECHPSENSLYKIHRDSVTSTTSSKTENTSDYVKNAEWKIIWMRQK